MTSLPPTKVTGELRDWYYDDARLAYVGEMWRCKSVKDGTSSWLYSRKILEVNEFSDYYIVVMKPYSGGSQLPDVSSTYILWKDREHKRITND